MVNDESQGGWQGSVGVHFYTTTPLAIAARIVPSVLTNAPPGPRTRALAAVNTNSSVCYSVGSPTAAPTMAPSLYVDAASTIAQPSAIASNWIYSSLVSVGLDAGIRTPIAIVVRTRKERLMCFDWFANSCVLCSNSAICGLRR